MLRFKGGPAALVALCMMVGASLSANAASIRVDEGGGIWNNQQSPFGVPIGIGFNFDLHGYSFNSVTPGLFGVVDLGNGASITPFLVESSYGWIPPVLVNFGLATNTNPIPGVESGFRMDWAFGVGAPGEQFRFQLGLFDLIGDDFLLEFNYQSEAGPAFELPEGAQFGLFNNGLGTSFNLSSILATLQPGCLSSLGQGDDTDEIAECTGFFVDGVFQGALPADFAIVNPTDERIADGRYLYRISGRPAAVPEPGSLALMSLGVALLLWGMRRGRATARA